MIQAVVRNVAIRLLVGAIVLFLLGMGIGAIIGSLL